MAHPVRAGWLPDDTSEEMMEAGLDANALFRQQCYVGGQWINAEDGQTLSVVNPASGQILGTVPEMKQADTLKAIDAAVSALPLWRATPVQDRAHVIRGWADLISAHITDLAELITCEHGKPLAQARKEVEFTARLASWTAERMREVLLASSGLTSGADTAETQGPKVTVTRSPVGVCAAMTSAYFPLGIVMYRIVSALAAGCPVIVKPALQTPCSALALAVLAQQAGFPAGVLNIMTGSMMDVGVPLAASADVHKISFTGAAEIGSKFIGQCGLSGSRVRLDCGGGIPFIIFEDADFEAAINGVLSVRFFNSGMAATSISRLLVQKSISEEFAHRLASRVERLAVGNGLAEGVQIGPVPDRSALDRLQACVDDAVTRGARVLTGGKKHALGGMFFEPTVLTDVMADMRIALEPVCGPVAALMYFEDEAEAQRIANEVHTRRAAFFYTCCADRSWRMASALNYSVICVNTTKIGNEVLSLAGLGPAGGGGDGIVDYVETKYLCQDEIFRYLR